MKSFFAKRYKFKSLSIVSDREQALQNDSPLFDLLYIHQHFGLCRLTCFSMAQRRECYLMLQLTFKGECTYFWLNHNCQLGPNISNSNLLQNMEASQTIKNPWCLLNGKHCVSWCFKDRKSSKEKKLTLYFKRVMSFQVLNDVLPSVSVSTCVCLCVCVYANFYRTRLDCGSQLYNPIHTKKNAAWLKLVCSISIMFLSPNG